MEHEFIIITDSDEIFNYPPLQTIYNNWAGGSLRTTKYWMSEYEFLDILKFVEE